MMTVLATLLLLGGKAMADNVITTNNVSIRPGGTAELVVSLESDADFSVYAYDFRLYLPDGIEVEQNSLGVYQYELKERNAGHAVNVQATSDGSVQFGVSSPTLALTGNTGEVLGITLRAEDGLAEGNYQAAIKFVTYANKEAQTVHPADITFDIEVRNMMILDENAVTPPETASNVNVKVLRTINAGEWSTICLPFAMTEEQVTTAFGDDVELGNFTGYTTEEDAGENITGIRVLFTPATAIEANHPYIIKVSQAVSEFTADGVDVEPEDEPTVAAVKRTKKQWSEFIGTYVAGTTVEDQMLFLSGNQFWYSTGQTQMKAFRGYFDFYDVLTEVENAANISFYVGDEATEISLTPNAPVAESGIYDLQGRKMNGNVQLPKGIYILNGKKVVK